MFKSKPCNPHHQWQHDINPTHISPCQKAPYASGSEERSPDPKPRWNPKPEQIRILEAIFNSGMVNPPRDEIRRIRVQLQEYGQVGDANVFYWFQNRKSRSKHKQRSHLHTSKTHPQSSSVAATTFVAPSSSSSSSSEKSPRLRTNNLLQMGGSCSGVNIIDAANSPTASVNQQTYFQSQGDFSTDPFFHPVLQQTAGNNNTLLSQGLCFPELSNIVQIPDQVIVPCTGFLLSELLNQNATKRDEEQEKLKLEQQLSYTAVTTTNSTTTTTTPNTIQGTTSSTNVGSININQIQGN
ncbi:Wuschel-related homeobox [Thalictrum thalictroides]|uniref:Wuschel-related homeobox n=1 Tax=Thalictrum thalictroides TaxID=46969 RepID=A0A7J6W0D6_THATH|nr:Wuschel-related homeobox [Thalictrum thalictroides]